MQKIRYIFLSLFIFLEFKAYSLASLEKVVAINNFKHSNKNIILNSHINICNYLINKIYNEKTFILNTSFTIDKNSTTYNRNSEYRYGLHEYENIVDSCKLVDTDIVKFSVERLNPAVLIKKDRKFELPKFDIYFKIIEGSWQVLKVESDNCVQLIIEVAEFRYTQLAHQYRFITSTNPFLGTDKEVSCMSYANGLVEYFSKLIQ